MPITKTFQVAEPASIVAGKNFAHNGGFDIWQRGTSHSTDTLYTADRWKISSNGAAFTISRQLTGLAGIQYCARVQRNSGNTNTAGMYFGQAFPTEDIIGLQGKTVTISFYARAGANYSAASSLFNLGANWGTGSGGQVFAQLTNDTFIGQTSNSLTTSWQRFTWTISLPSTATELRYYFWYTPVGTAGANDYFEVTGVQVEAGNVATPFSRNGGTYQGELAACQRYYWRQTSGAAYTPFANGFMQDANNGMAVVTPPVPMRIIPYSLEYSTLQIIDSSYSTSGGTPAFGISESGSFPLRMYWISATGQTANRPAVVRAGNSSTAYIAFNAEL
jgi:hypothetical protein